MKYRKMPEMIAGVHTHTHTHTCSFKKIKDSKNITNVDKEERQILNKSEK